MRTLLALLASLLPATLAVSRPPLPPAKGHDLRGPALKKGLTLVVKSTASCKDGDLEIDAGTGKMAFKMTTTAESHKEVELVAVANRQPTECLSRIVKMEQKVTLTGNNAPPAFDTPSPLKGQRVRSRLVNKVWQHDLDKGEASEEQKAQLKRFGPWSPEDGLFPARKVRVGDSWDVTKKDLTTFPGGGVKVKAFSASGKGKLRAIERYQGEMCAVVDYTLTMSGTEDEQGAGVKTEATVKMTVWRSLRLGLTVRMTSESALKATSEKIKMKMTGAQKLEMTVTVKE